MTEILLFIIIITFVIYHAWYIKQNQHQIKTLTKAILSKNLDEFVTSEIREDVVKKETKEKEEDFVEVKDLSDKDFGKMIKKQIKA